MAGVPKIIILCNNSYFLIVAGSINLLILCMAGSLKYYFLLGFIKLLILLVAYSLNNNFFGGLFVNGWFPRQFPIC